jgi:putative ABC transport system permease protein
VAQRTQEIGVRMANGATQAQVLRQVVGDGSRLALVGTLLGLAGAAAMAGVLRGLLDGVTPSDGLTFVSAAVILGTVAIAASLIPAWRASHIDPVTALRQD